MILEGLEKDAREAKKGCGLILHLSHHGSIAKRDGANHLPCQTSYFLMLKLKARRRLVARHELQR
jgi:hypothetical protein